MRISNEQQHLLVNTSWPNITKIQPDLTKSMPLSAEQETREICSDEALACSFFEDAAPRRVPQCQQVLQQERTKLRQQVHVLARSLENAKLQLDQLAQIVVSVQEEERRRIACELHDGVGQSAALILIQADRLAQAVPSLAGRPEGELAAIRQYAQFLNTTIREVSHQLHPSILTDLGLCAAMSSLVDDFRGGGGRIDLEMRDVTEAIPEDVALTLYRIAQEALHNVAKHAAYAPVRVVLQQNATRFRMSVKDAGPGFNPEEVRSRGSLGLLSMRERARLAGGSLLVRSALGKGTLLITSVPIGNYSYAEASSGKIEPRRPKVHIPERTGQT
jgi:two-component system, chemotaxis family, CheB/CheR fusion protein